MEEVTNEVKAINAVLKGADKNALFGPSVDDLFTSYGDVWEHIKKYHEKYGTMPSFEQVHQHFDGDIPDVNVPGQVAYYIDNLRSEYTRNRIENLLTRAGREFSDGMSAEEIKDKLQTALHKLDRFTVTGRDLSVMDLEAAKRRYEETRERSIAMGGTPGVPFGLDLIDACCPLGQQPGDVTSIIGYPARGKSALGTLFAAKAITKGYKPLIFSREMSAEAVQDRIFTILGSGIFSNTSLMLGDINMDDFHEWAKDYRAMEDFCYIVDGNGSGPMTPNFIRGKIDQYRPDYVTMDYLQLFHDNRLSDDMTGRMRNLSLEIKDASNQTRTPFVVISSATPPDGGKVDGPPNVERSAWSRQLAYDSTVCFSVHRIDDTDIYQVDAQKNRYGALFSGFLRWSMDTGIYEEVTEV